MSNSKYVIATVFMNNINARLIGLFIDISVFLLL